MIAAPFLLVTHHGHALVTVAATLATARTAACVAASTLRQRIDVFRAGRLTWSCR